MSVNPGARQMPGSYPAASEGQHEGLGNDAQEQLVGKAMRSFQEQMERPRKRGFISRLSDMMASWQGGEIMRLLALECESSAERVKQEQMIESLTQRLRTMAEENESRARLIEDMELREGDEPDLIRQYRKEELVRAKQEAEELRKTNEDLRAYRAQVVKLWQILMSTVARFKQRVEELVDLINEEKEERLSESAEAKEAFRAIVESLPVNRRDPEIMDKVLRVLQQS